jgi:hypothetical protein
MKDKKSRKEKKKQGAQTGKELQQITARAALAEKLLKAARNHLHGIKLEHKQARKAFKQAKKNAKRSRKALKLAVKRTKDRSKSSSAPKVKAAPASRPKRAVAKPKPNFAALPSAASPSPSTSAPSTSTASL